MERGAQLDTLIRRRRERVTQGSTEPCERTTGEKVDYLRDHFRSMVAQRGIYSCTLCRKFAGWYGSRLGIPEELEDRLRRFETTAEFDEIVAQIRRRHGERKTSVPTALIKVPNGPIERW